MPDSQPDILDLRYPQPGSTLVHPITGVKAWTRGEATAADWTVTLDPQALDEMCALVDSLRRDPLPILMLDADSLDMPACRAAMTRVRTLLDEDLAANTHQVNWTGDDDNGRTVSAGVYFYMVTSGESRSVGRMALIK